jgi:hypothetical protein
MLKKLSEYLKLRTNIPEPSRIVHPIASGVVYGKSRGNAELDFIAEKFKYLISEVTLNGQQI